MRENYNKFLSGKYFASLLALLCLIVFLSSTINTYAASSPVKTTNLEVYYPTIAGKTLSADTSLPSYVKYLFDVAMIIGFLSAVISLTIAGAMYFLSPLNASLKASARDRVYSALSGLLILVMTYLIITTINPALNVLSFSGNQSSSSESSQEEIKDPGVYFYTSKKCSDKDIQPNISSIRDFGQLKNKIGSVGIIQDQENENFYVSILYSNPDFWGQCQYLDPNKECQEFSPFANSASVYQYDTDPNGDGVYFYRKSCFSTYKYEDTNSIISYCNENSGGYYKVSNEDILNENDSSVFIVKLDSLSFKDVPKEEKDCKEYDNQGRCTENGRTKVSLGGGNISSIIINGDYLVVLFYRGINDKKYGPWSSCQEFPTEGDVNKTGPRQIKWENIRNSGGVLPNYVMILPIKNKYKQPTGVSANNISSSVPSASSSVSSVSSESSSSSSSVGI